MLITGASSGYGNISTVVIQSGGAGYNNTNIITFTGGNTGVGSYPPGNASLITDSSGAIVAVNLSANAGNLIVSNPTLAVVNSSGGSTGVGTGADLIPGFHYGFVKFPLGSIDDPLQSLFTFQTKTIGTIASLVNINPGENYNLDPFVNVYEPLVASYGRKDYIIGVANTNGTFIVGETVVQTINSASIIITSNTFSGNATSQYEVGEAVFSTDGITNVASGILNAQVISAPNYTLTIREPSGNFTNTISASILTVSTNTGFAPGSAITQGSASGTLVNSNTTTLVVKSVTGTFAANATSVTSNTGGTATISAANNSGKIYRLFGLTSKGVTEVSNTDSTVLSLQARGVVKTVNSTSLSVARRSLFNQFTPSVGNDLIGQSSGASAVLVSVTIDGTSNTVGDNAIITANVVTTSGSMVSVDVVDSGYGYIQDETVDLLSNDGLRSSTGKVVLNKTGQGKGYYGDNNGLLDDNKFIIDGEYYQEYSYEVQSNLPFETYAELLREVVHVSGTKMFGRIKTSTVSNNNLTIANSAIEIA